jgi:hypothetical protein
LQIHKPYKLPGGYWTAEASYAFGTSYWRCHADLAVPYSICIHTCWHCQRPDDRDAPTLAPPVQLAQQERQMDGAAVPSPELEYIRPLPLPSEQHESSFTSLLKHHLTPSAHISNSIPTQDSFALLPILRCHPNTIAMPSIESKNWITALVVGILGLALTTFGVILAYKQLRQTKRSVDVENSAAKGIVRQEVAMVVERAESLR